VVPKAGNNQKETFLHVVPKAGNNQKETFLHVVPKAGNSQKETFLHVVPKAGNNQKETFCAFCAFLWRRIYAGTSFTCRSNSALRARWAGAGDRA
jgi:hypothetical protein